MGTPGDVVTTGEMSGDKVGLTAAQMAGMAAVSLAGGRAGE